MRVEHIGDATLYLGDVRETLREIPDESVQCVVTSPPYWKLRDYSNPGQLGLEPTPDEYVAEMVAVFREVRRVLRADGVLWLNLGDSYAGGPSSGTNGWKHGSIGSCSDQGRGSPVNKVSSGLKPKDLVGIPWRVAFALQADGWYLRQDIIWHKPNPMPESVTDRCTKAHEYVFLLTKSARYYYDAEAVKEDADPQYKARYDYDFHTGAKESGGQGRPVNAPNTAGMKEWTGTRNRRSVWTVTTQPYSGAHFATFPPKLIEPMILAGSRPGDTVLDPFGGSGTTAGVALEHGRNAILCELSEEYAALVPDRIRSITDALDQPGLFTDVPVQPRFDGWEA